MLRQPALHCLWRHPETKTLNGWRSLVRMPSSAIFARRSCSSRRAFSCIMISRRCPSPPRVLRDLQGSDEC